MLVNKTDARLTSPHKIEALKDGEKGDYVTVKSAIFEQVEMHRREDCFSLKQSDTGVCLK